MGNGNPSSGGGGGGGGGAGTPLPCDVGLGLNSDPSNPCKKTSYMSLSSLYHHQASETGSEFGGVCGNGNRIGSGISFKSTADGVMGTSGKMLFTATQWQELQRQTMIYKYIIASVPIPPHLLLSLSTQSNRVSMGLRFANGSDPEPWRCRRTDGKKWRCSKDVAPDQKYCERHSHKTRSRSRKPVETQSHKTKHDYHSLLPTADTKNKISNPSLLSLISSSNQQTSDWLMKNGVMDVSVSSNQFQQPMNSPIGGEIYRNDEHKPFLDYTNPYTNTTASDAAASARRQQFIDAWSRVGSRDDCSLTLSMQSGGNGMEFENHESLQMAVGMLDGERDVSKSQHHWLNWEGGPLGEALCLETDTPAYIPPNVPPSFH